MYFNTNVKFGCTSFFLALYRRFGVFSYFYVDVLVIVAVAVVVALDRARKRKTCKNVKVPAAATAASLTRIYKN